MLQYFISTHGARKGLADTALKTAIQVILPDAWSMWPRTQLSMNPIAGRWMELKWRLLKRAEKSSNMWRIESWAELPWKTSSIRLPVK